MKAYDHKEIEPKWQKEWENNATYKTKDTSDKPKCYVLDMFPYPSGEGLHVGHPKGYIATDVYSRFKSMSGFNVLHPMGWDAFGLPAENYAIKNKVHPRVAVEKNVKRYKEQLAVIGFNYDWSREVDTTDPDYYKWTQWIFLKLFEKGLAYESHEPINWCPSCQTGLANEDLEGGLCERCGSVVEKKPIRQWVLKITDYADRLLADLPALNWPESIKESQKNWIGRSEGMLFTAPVKDTDLKIQTFSAHFEAFCADTFVAIAPDHPFLSTLVAGLPNAKDILAKAKEMTDKRLADKFGAGKEVDGIFTGRYIVDPVGNGDLPIWVASFALADYGTGIVKCSAHDERDFAFAKKYDIPLKKVLEPIFIQKTEPGKWKENEPFVEREVISAIVKHWSEDKYIGLKWKKVDWETIITGGVENDQTPEEAAIAEIREETGYQNPKLVKVLDRMHSKFFHPPKNVNRFAHFNVMYFELADGTKEDISAEEQSNHELVWLTKEEMEKFRLPEGQRYSWDQLMGKESAWTDMKNGILTEPKEFAGKIAGESRQEIIKYLEDHKLAEKKVTYRLNDWVFSRQRYWGEPIPLIHCEKCGVVAVPEKDLPVKLPEVEHYEPTGTGESPLANIADWVNTVCPKCGGPGKRETNTMPQWAGSSWYYLRYIDPKNSEALVDKAKEKYWSPIDFYVGGAEHATRHLIYARFWHKFLFDIGAVNYPEPFARLQHVGLILAEDGRKMSKRWGNVINPDDIINLYGADTLRLYEMFMGPFDQSVAWSTESIIGPRRFIERVWRLREKVGGESHSSLSLLLNQTIKKVGEDIESFGFNTAISQLMILVNEMEKQENIAQNDYEVLLKLIAPFAPHAAEELWYELGNKESIHLAPWPTVDESKLESDTAKITVQVNGKVRTVIDVARGSAEDDVLKMVLALDVVKKWLGDKTPVRVIFVKNKLINIVI